LQDRPPAALCRGHAEANLVRGTFLRMTDLRFRPAYISVTVSRITTPRRVVEITDPAHRPPSLHSRRRHADSKP
jgi:hypothetical protein